MKRIAWSTLRKSTIEGLEDELPLAIEVNGALWAVLAPIEDIVVVGDLHPEMQYQIRSLEALARQGKPLEKIWSAPVAPPAVEKVTVELPSVEEPVVESSSVSVGYARLANAISDEV